MASRGIRRSPVSVPRRAARHPDAFPADHLPAGIRPRPAGGRKRAHGRQVRRMKTRQGPAGDARGDITRRDALRTSAAIAAAPAARRASRAAGRLERAAAAFMSKIGR